MTNTITSPEEIRPGIVERNGREFYSDYRGGMTADLDLPDGLKAVLIDGGMDTVAALESSEAYLQARFPQMAGIIASAVQRAKRAAK